jgi:ABC-2 type transport system permease protein
MRTHHLSNVLRLGVKELRSFAADPVLVLLILYAFSFAIYTVATGLNYDVERAAVAIVDEDRSALSRRIGASILEPTFRPPVAITAADIDAAMDSGRFVFVVEIPPRFEADVLAGRRPSIQINIDATAMTLAGNGAAYLQNIIQQEVLGYLQEKGQGSPAQSANLVARVKFNPNVQSPRFTSVMQIINNITLLTVILAGAALIREREHGTIEHLLVMPVTPAEIMVAKIWANGLVIVTAAILSLLLVVQGFLQVPIAGSLGLFIAGAVLYQFSVTALGILLATFTRSMPQLALLSIPILIAMNLLSGSTTPLESMPVWLQYVMSISPSTYFVSFAQAVLYRGADIGTVWPQMIALTAIGAAFFGLALWRFRGALARVQ